jgi:hypothetical protein
VTETPLWRLLYFGTDWNAQNRTSVHHVARWLGDRHEMLYFECPGLRAPTTSGGDMGRLWRKLTAAFAAPRRPLPRVQVRTLLQLPFHRLPGIGAINRRLLRFQVRLALRAAGPTAPGQATVAWFALPHIASLAGRLGEDLVVYYCVDDFAAFPGVVADQVRAWDEQLTRAADLVFVASRTLIPAKEHLARVVHAPHGVDVAHFAAARERRGERPADLPERGLIVGYFGLVAEWIDLDLIGRLAARHPDWQFVMIGRIAVPEDRLPRAANLHYLGQRPYEELPRYGAWFDVAIIPYRLTDQVLNANPIKLREYLAMAKPIVSVSTPEIDPFAELVTIVEREANWDTALTALLHETETDAATRRARQVAAAEQMSWDTRIGAVEDQVRRALEQAR